MKQVQDRKKLRREYLEARRAFYVQMFQWLAVLLPFIVILMFLIYICFQNTMQFPAFALLEAFGGLFCLVFVSVLGYALVTECGAIKREIDALPYAPPVTSDDLPADEILVRGSEEPPVVQSDVLLRAANEVEAPKDELLRVSQEE